MRIGFDAKWFFTGNPSGRVIVRNLLQRLLDNNQYKEHEFYIFLDKADKDKDFPYAGPNVHLVYVWAKINLLSNFFFVPLEARSLGLDVFLFQYFAPITGKYKKITFINDIIFKDHPGYFTLTERLYFLPMGFLARRAHRLITISHSEKERLIYYKFFRRISRRIRQQNSCSTASGQIEVIHLGVDNCYKPKEEHPQSLLEETREKYHLPGKFLLYLGRLNERKNLANLVKALPYLEDKNIQLVLAGTYDWKMYDLPALTKALGIQDRVIFTGYIEDQYLPPLYALATVFCYVSFDEGFGLPPVEAMASGVPVVAANTGSLPEICEQAALYAAPGDPQEIAAQIDRLLSDPAVYEEKRALGLQRATTFTWEKAACQVIETCQTTINEK